MRTADDAITEARLVLQDTVVPYRYPTVDLIRYLNNGLYELKRLRPDIFLAYVGQPVPQYIDDPISLAELIPVADIFYQPLVLFMAGYAELRDDEFTVDARASILLRSFATSLTLPAGAAV